MEIKGVLWRCGVAEMVCRVLWGVRAAIELRECCGGLGGNVGA